MFTVMECISWEDHGVDHGNVFDRDSFLTHDDRVSQRALDATVRAKKALPGDMAWEIDWLAS